MVLTMRGSNYVCAGLCTKGRKADYAYYCQHCDKYKPKGKDRK